MGFLPNKKRPSYAMLNTILFLIVLFAQLVLAGGNKNMIFIILAVSIVLSLKATKMELLCATMFLLPNNQYINFGGISIITIMVTLYFLKAVIFEKAKIHFPLLIFSMLLVSYSLFFLFVTRESRIIVEAAKNFLFLFFCVDIFADTRSSLVEKYINGVKYLIKGLIFSSVLTMILNPTMLDKRFALSPDQTPNTIGILSGFAIGCVLMITQTKYFKVTKIWLYTIIPLMIIGFWTQSKSFFFSVLIAFTWVMFFRDRKFDLEKKYRLLVVLLIGVVFYLATTNVGGQFSEVISRTMDRIFNPRGGDISTGRFELWNDYLNEIKSDGYIFFFGSGSTMSSNTMVAHNLWIEQWYSFGAIGNIIIILTFWVSVSCVRKKNSVKKLSLYGFLPSILIFATSFFSHTFVGGADTIRFFLAVIAVYVFAEENQKEPNYCC